MTGTSPERAATVTSGQAAYAVVHGDGTPGWEALDGRQRDLWEIAGQAAIRAGTVVTWHECATCEGLAGRADGLAAEGNELRALVAEILGRFHYLHQDFMECDTTPDEYARWRELAGLTPAVATAGTEHLADEITRLAIGAEDQP